LARRGKANSDESELGNSVYQNFVQSQLGYGDLVLIPTAAPAASKYTTGFLSYSQGLRPQNTPHIPKPRITSDSWFCLLWSFLPSKSTLSADNRGKNQQITNFAYNLESEDSHNKITNSRITTVGLPGVNFTNILLAQIPKAQKYSQAVSLFCAFGILGR